jgi:hypothetical protein
MIAAATLAAATPALAGVVVYADEAAWQAATPKSRSVDIDAGPNVIRLGEGAVSITFDQVVFSQDGSLTAGPLFYIPAGKYGSASADVSSQQGALQNILITLPTATHALALDFGTFNGRNVDFRLSTGETFTLPTPSLPNYSLPRFFGVTSDTAFDSLRLTTTSYVLNVGDVSYGVPEPSAWALMLLGVAGAGLALRRRRGPVAA